MSATDATTIVLCLVTNGRHDASLGCAISMLRLQTELMGTQQRLHADMHVVNTLDDALNVLHTHPTAKGMVLAETTMGFDARFPLAAMRSGEPLVVASYPLPHVNWERVATQPGGDEPPAHWGHEYNVTPVAGARPDERGYLEVEREGAKLGVCWVSREVTTAIASKTDNFAMPGIYDGRRMDGYQRFLSLYDGKVMADVERPASSSGPMEFGGCVGARTVLR